jgi:hypothetical protein
LSLIGNRVGQPPLVALVSENADKGGIKTNGIVKLTQMEEIIKEDKI